MMGGFVVKDNEEYDILPVDKKEGSTGYLLAVKKDFATQVLSLDSISGNDYKVQLNGLYSLDYTKPLNSVFFNGFVDKTKEIHLRFIEFKNDITEALRQYQFNAIKDPGEGFSQETNNPDLILNGEIIHYTKSSKDTRGFKTTVVVNWTLFDVAKDEVVCVILTGGYSNNQKKINEYSALRLALMDAVGGLVVSKEIHKYIYKSRNTASEAGSPGQEIVISIGPVKSIGNNYIHNAVQSSVTLKTDAGHGSGFLISSSGYILTNFHVINDSANLQAIFQNGMTLPARVVCYNKKTDVALCKIPGTGYKPLLLDTNYIMDNIGVDIVAIGTPKDIGLGQSVTKGIISGIREFEGEKYIQIDASVNPGNSGGPLITNNGQVVGIITLKRKDSEGIGFAVPIAKALQILNIKLISKD